MRLHLSKYIKKDDYLVHADMWNSTRFPIDGNIINCGLGETNSLNIVGGIASTGKTVYVYGVAGFIIHRLEQLKFNCRDFGANTGKIIIINAGRVGYDKLGAGHLLDDDKAIMNMLGIRSYYPDSLEYFNIILNFIDNLDTGIFYIQLGKDY